MRQIYAFNATVSTYLGSNRTEGSGNLVKAVEGEKVTVYIGNHIEGWRSYYGVYTERMRSAGTARIAMRLEYDCVKDVYSLLTEHGNYWTPNPSPEPHETFANMFAGYVNGTRSNDSFGKQRNSYMTTNMTKVWLPALVP